MLLQLENEEKLKAVALEYLLTSQLDSQRQYFEQRLAELESKALAQVRQRRLPDCSTASGTARMK